MKLELICAKCNHLMVRQASPFFKYTRFVCEKDKIIIDSPNLHYIECETQTQESQS